MSTSRAKGLISSGPALLQIGQNTLPYQQTEQEGEAEIQERG